MTAADRRLAWIFFVAAFVVLAAGFGLRDPWPADEPRFVLVAKQMVESGDWLFPHRGIELYPDKPPVYFWLLAMAYAVVGSWRWSFLLPSLLAGLGTLALVFDLGRRLWTPRAGLWAATAVLVSFQFVYQATRAQIDPTLVFLTTLGFYALCRHALLGPHWRWLYVGGIASGVGVITKGVGFLPLLALLPLAAMARTGWQGLTPAGPGHAGRWALLAPAFLLPIALWLAPLLWLGLGAGTAEHEEYLRNILFKQTAQRYADPWHHHEPFWYFGQVIVLFWLPFSLALPWLLRPWRDAWRARDARVWLPLAWALLVVLFFSLSAGKRDMYVLPALPALALAAAPFLDDVVKRRGFRWLLLAFAVALSAVLLAGGVAALTGDLAFEKRLVAERGLDGRADGLWWMLVVVGGLGLLSAALMRVRRAPVACAVLLGSLWCGYGFVVHPLLDAQSSAAALMREARRVAGEGVTLGLVDWKEQNLLQARGPVVDFGFRQPPAVQLQRGLAWMAQDPGRRELLVQRGPALACLHVAEGGRVHRVGVSNRREWWLVDAQAAASCTAADAAAAPAPVD